MTERVDVLIIGAGFSGLCVAFGLQKLNRLSFRIVERADEVGGTWRDNKYPGCACDIPSPLYSFSFAQRAEWSRLFAPQPEILEYLRDFASDNGLRDRIHFDTKLVDAKWDETTETWSVTAGGGRRYIARFVVSAIGPLHVPSVPTLPGIESFRGEIMHSATWDHSVRLHGRRVAVIGTGASAIQIVPAIVDQVERLVLFQRTPPWIVPQMNPAFSTRHRRLRRFPPYRWYERQRLFWIHESRRKGFTDHASGMAETERIARSYLRRQIRDPDLRAKLTPDYAIGCKRLLISSDYYPALGKANVSVQTSAIADVRAESIVTADGTERPVDVIIYCTGFDAQHGLAEIPITGRAGQTLSERWCHGPEAYLGTTMSGFPNYFMMVGPNSGLGHNSQIFMIEVQARYVLSCIKAMRRRGLRVIEIDAGVEQRYNSWVQQLLKGSVWQAGGCRSWYQDAETGLNTLLWPTSTLDFWRRTRRARLSDYECK